MGEPQPIRIVGGGLAGLTLGIALRQRQVPVTVLEAGKYPRHRVCGEFISGQGQTTLERLDLKDKLLRAGGRWAESAIFHAPQRPPLEERLPQPALCLSRYVLDDLLAREFCRLGGELRVHQRCGADLAGEGVVRATGRRAQASVQGWRWCGLKVHARGVRLQADLEMHLVPGGYVGLCLLNDEVNVCGLFRSRTPMPHLGQQWQDLLRGPPGSTLRQRLNNATLDESSFCAVAGLYPEPRPAGEPGQCALGDALTMTPPITGNGLSMALESAELAVEPLIDYHRGARTWEEARREIARRCEERFRLRLWTATWLHRALFQPLARRLLSEVLGRFPGVWRVVFGQTR